MIKSLAPYKLFFPLGICNALLAVGIWSIHNPTWTSAPTLLIHSRLIIGGFLWSFILGFLMTATPKMTGTHAATPIEYLISTTLALGLSLFSWIEDGLLFYTTQVLLILFLIVYLGRRILMKTASVPVFFSHVIIALSVALLGSYFHSMGQSFLGLHLYQVGSILILILGIGARFFSFLSGLPSPIETTLSQKLKFIFHISGVSLAALFYLAGLGFSNAYLGIALFSFFYLLKIWQIFRFSNHFSALKLAVRIVATSIPISFILTWLFPLYYIAWFHLLFICCFALITFSVATRVILAHGSYPLEIEKTSISLKIFIPLFLFGAIFRVCYGLTTGIWKTTFLHLAAMFWLIAILSWSFSFLIKIIKPGAQNKPSC